MPLYREFIGELKKAGYTGRISVECGFNDFEKEAAQALGILHQLDEETRKTGTQIPGLFFPH